jgi:hypothetical protein
MEWRPQWRPFNNSMLNLCYDLIIGIFQSYFKDKIQKQSFKQNRVSFYCIDTPANIAKADHFQYQYIKC